MSSSLFFRSDRSSNDVLAGSPPSFQRWKKEAQSTEALSRYSSPQLPQNLRKHVFRSKHPPSDEPLKHFTLGSSLSAAISESIRNGDALRKAVETTIHNAQTVGVNSLSIDLTSVQKELDKDAQRKRNMSNDDRCGALDLAASFGASPIVRLLLQHDRNIAPTVCPYTSSHRSNAMILAAEHGHEEAVYELINSGPIDPKPWSYAIRRAVRNRFESVALMLAQQDLWMQDAQWALWVEEANNLFLQAANLDGNQRLMNILLSKYPISPDVLGQSLKHFCNYGNETLAMILEALVKVRPIERGIIEAAVEAGAGRGHPAALQLLLNYSSISLSSRGKAARSAAFHGNEQALIVLQNNGPISEEDLDFALAVAKTMACANILKGWRRSCAIQ